MFLRRVTVTGFKSFANKTVLDLEPGITAVVGPNGSGKSNLADAVRWAFGEQSKGRLRLGDREDVVFVGSEKRARASFAEVILLFDNEDGAFPLDLTEVEISRRLYRSGESDYRLAGRSVRLSDLQALLAQAGFGTNTYAVIGQGTIDSFLMSSPAERKLLFDEAAGVRGPELGRESARRKLTATAANLVRLRDIEAELSPRLELLEHTVKAAEVHRELEQKVERLRASVAAVRLAHWTRVHEQLTNRREELAGDVHRLRDEHAGLERQLAAAQAQTARSATERERLQGTLTALEQERDHLALDLAERRSAVAEAERAAAQVLELSVRCDAAREDLAEAQARNSELKAEQAGNAEASARALKAVEAAAGLVASAQTALVAIRREGAADGTRDQYIDHALQILKILATNLSSDEHKLDEVRLLVHKAGRLLSHASRTSAADLLDRLKSAQKQLETAMGRRETAVEHQTNVTITTRSLEIDLAHQHEAVARAEDQLEALEAQLAPIQTAAAELPDMEASATKLASALEASSSRLEQQREQIRRLSAVPDGAPNQAALATQLERAKAAAAASDAELAQLKTELASADSQLKAARQAASHASDQHVATTHRPLPDLEAELVRAEAQLEAHAGVQRDQAAEYEAVKDRHTDLTTQIADLTSAQGDLERVIDELDRLIRERFKTNFASLGEQFTAYFARLFAGGTASLELTETEDGSYGIIIKASPAGKRLASIAALSGGERALAGVALLAAILRVNPSPFVVLDEIDAALDEANSGRLSAILEELQEQSQLIVITHNRQTMRAARVLFGVTINEHKVSHLISMRLEEATQLAAR